MLEFLGKHFLIEYHRCDSKILNHQEEIEKIMLDASDRCGATVVGSSFHSFSPQGVSGVVLIAESHISVHTWPEYDYAAVDIFTCGRNVDPWIAINYLKVAFDSGEHSVQEIARGIAGSKIGVINSEDI